MVTARTAQKRQLSFKAILAITVGIAALVFPKTARAAAGAFAQCTASSSCTVGEFLFNDAYVPITSATCTITSSYPDGTSFLNNQSMTGTSDGFYRQAFTAPSTTGYYKTRICCTSGSDYLCMDKSFEVVAASTSLTTSDIASAVWGYSSRDVTNLGTVVRDVWAYTNRTLAGPDTTKSDTVAKQVNETHLLMEKLVNQPVIQNSLSEEVPDLSYKLENTSQSLGQLYINQQYVLSKVGLLALNWNNLRPDEISANLAELAKLQGNEGDDPNVSMVGQIGWLKKSWGWPEIDTLYSQNTLVKSNLAAVQAMLGTSGKSSAAYQVLKSALKNLETAEKLIGDSTDMAGAGTTYGQLKRVQVLAEAWEGKKSRLEKLLTGWNTTNEATAKTKTDDIYREVIALNQVPKVDQVLASQFKDVSDQKKLKNRVLGLRAVVEVNRLLLARNQGNSLASTWLEEGSIVFKTLVTNPSQLISQDVLVKYYLPPEVKQEDIIDHDSAVEVKYDTEKSQLYVQGKITVAAGETKTIMVRIQDIWKVSQTEMDSIHKQIQELSKPLEKTAYFAQGVTLAADTNASLDKVTALQQAAVTPEQKIRAYREAAIEMTAAKEKLAKLRDLVTQAGSAGTLFGFIGGAQVMAVWGLIIIVIAGFVFLALYMRTIAAGGVVKDQPIPPKGRSVWWAAVHLLIFGVISSATTGVVVWQIMLHSQKTASPASAQQPVASSSAVLAAQTPARNPDGGTGGPDIVKVVVPTGSVVNLRAEPSLTAKISSELKTTQEAVRLDQNKQWVKIEVNGEQGQPAGRQGWVALKYIEEAPTAATQPLEVVIGDTPTRWLRVRQKPDGIEIAKVESGKKYQLVSQTTGWWQIKLADGSVGWVSKQYADPAVVKEVN